MEDQFSPLAKMRGYKEENVQSVEEIGSAVHLASEMDESQKTGGCAVPTPELDQETINLLNDDRVSTGG